GTVDGILITDHGRVRRPLVPAHGLDVGLQDARAHGLPRLNTVDFRSEEPEPGGDEDREESTDATPAGGKRVAAHHARHGRRGERAHLDVSVRAGPTAEHADRGCACCKGALISRTVGRPRYAIARLGEKYDAEERVRLTPTGRRALECDVLQLGARVFGG